MTRDDARKILASGNSVYSKGRFFYATFGNDEDYCSHEKYSSMEQTLDCIDYRCDGKWDEVKEDE
jgi:hypothetical protein